MGKSVINEDMKSPNMMN